MHLVGVQATTKRGYVPGGAGRPIPGRTGIFELEENSETEMVAANGMAEPCGDYEEEREMKNQWE